MCRARTGPAERETKQRSRRVPYVRQTLNKIALLRSMHYPQNLRLVAGSKLPVAPGSVLRCSPTSGTCGGLARFRGAAPAERARSGILHTPPSTRARGGRAGVFSVEPRVPAVRGKKHHGGAAPADLRGGWCASSASVGGGDAPADLRRGTYQAPHTRKADSEHVCPAKNRPPVPVCHSES